MAQDNDIYKKVKSERDTHHIFSNDDQNTLADIIQQLGSASNTQAQTQQQTINKKNNLNNNPKPQQNINISASDEEIELLFERLKTFDLDKIAQQQNLYNIYLEKLQLYKNLPNFRKVLKKSEYYMVMIDHLDYMSKKIIDEQLAMEQHSVAHGM